MKTIRATPGHTRTVASANAASMKLSITNTGGSSGSGRLTTLVRNSAAAKCSRIATPSCSTGIPLVSAARIVRILTRRAP